MGRKSGTKLYNFCLNRLTMQNRAHASSPSIQGRTMSNSVKIHEKKEPCGDGEKPNSVVGRRIMIVVDSSLEAKCALQWALSHTVQSHDVIVLLSVTKPSSKPGDEEANVEVSAKNYEFLYSMKNMCHMKRPEVQVEFALVEGKEKGPTIVEQAKKQDIKLLVLGQKKRSMTWWMLMAWAGNKINGGVVEYCIQNATCMAIAVRRKSKKLGGFLITTKRQKDFWLLA